MPPVSASMLEAAEAPRARRRVHVSLPMVALAVGVVYFLWVALLATNTIVVQGLEPTITIDDWVQWGAGLMALLLIVLLVYYARHRGEVVSVGEPPPPEAGHGPRWVPDELVVTAEVWKGLRVLEYSRPPKSEHTTAVYTKVMVPVDGQYVLRVEDLVAEAG